jgi:ornithine cyclodeaminase/alanine dehydrogenase-like protein (mu-crystallin family)
VRGLRPVRDFRRILVRGRNLASVERYADEMRQELGVEVWRLMSSPYITAGVQDTIIAVAALSAAQKLRLGKTFEV